LRRNATVASTCRGWGAEPHLHQVRIDGAAPTDRDMPSASRRSSVSYGSSLSDASGLRRPGRPSR
jgi:hypothetical protein